MIDVPASKPSLALVTVSLAVLTACLFTIAAGVSSVFVTWDPCAVIGGLMLLPVPTLLGLQQYRGTFRRNATAALVSTIIYWGIGAFALFAFATMLGEALLLGVDQLPWASILLPSLGVAGILGVAGWMNFSWSRRLARATPVPSSARIPWYRSRRDVVAGIAAIACVVGLATYFIRSTPPRFAAGVSRDEAPFALPEGARDISYCQGYRGTKAFEFTIDEPGFVAWVESGIGSIESNSADVRLEPISGPYKITRWFDIAPGVDGPDILEIADGLTYVWKEEDRGVYAAFDRTTGRAYYFAHFH